MRHRFEYLRFQPHVFHSRSDSDLWVNRKFFGAYIVDDNPSRQARGRKVLRTVAVNIPDGHVNGGKASISSKLSVVNSGASLSTTSNTASSTASLTTASRPVATSPAPPDLTSSKVNLVVKLFQNLSFLPDMSMARQYHRGHWYLKGQPLHRLWIRHPPLRETRV